MLAFLASVKKVLVERLDVVKVVFLKGILNMVSTDEAVDSAPIPQVKFQSY